ncbi:MULTISPECIES: hypothetical protein [unclassified Sphingomonas]|jgi:hypothetical protein|uniref:hypothetical protein n=1 Tax=unclassified Sphingomonas TaxID=196159 RepID=UPI000B138EC5|nr:MULTISPECIES: hypothetical protein [unclassified Sphingomonas]
MNDDSQPEHSGGDLPFARAYDFFKHMTGISLVSLGGVFAFVGGGAIKVEPVKLYLALGFIGLGGVISLFHTTVLAALETRSVPREKLAKQVRYGQYAVTALLMAGVGAFVQSLAKVIL